MLSITHAEESGELISSYQYTLNDVGLRTSAEIAYGRPWPKTVTEDYEYDKLRRLTGVSDNLGFAATYEYDKSGNRTRWAANDDQTTQVANDAFDISYSYNDANQLLTEQRGNKSTTYSYDGNGNRTNKEWAQTGHPYTYGTDYTYDREDRLTNALNYRVNDSLQAGHRRNKDETVLAYDGIGRRMNKEYSEHDNAGRNAMTEYVFDGLDVVAEYPVAEQGEPIGRNNHRNEFYYNDNMQIVSQRRFPNGVEAQAYTYHYDGRMNVVSLSEETNRAWVHYQYDAYGQQLPEWGNASHPEWRDHNAYKVTGKEYDENLGMSYFGSRHYEAETGVWPTQDSFRGFLDLPESLHRYAFVVNSPINFYDVGGFGLRDWVKDKTKKVGEGLNKAGQTVNEGIKKAGEGLKKAGEAVNEGIKKTGKGLKKFGQYVWENKAGLTTDILTGFAVTALCGTGVGCALGAAIAGGAIGNAAGGIAGKWLDEGMSFKDSLNLSDIGKGFLIGGIGGGLTFGLSNAIGFNNLIEKGAQNFLSQTSRALFGRLGPRVGRPATKLMTKLFGKRTRKILLNNAIRGVTNLVFGLPEDIVGGFVVEGLGKVVEVFPMCNESTFIEDIKESVPKNTKEDIDFICGIKRSFGVSCSNPLSQYR